MKILLAIDQSPQAFTIVREFLARPWPSDTTVRIVSAVEQFEPADLPLEPKAAETLGKAHDVLLQQARALTEDVARSLLTEGLKIETAVCSGDPRMVIVEEAERMAADLIVLGSNDGPGGKQPWLGSVAQSVVGQASCSVEIIRQRPA